MCPNCRTAHALQYALDPELALGEAAHVVRPSGRIAVCKSGPPDANEFFAFLLSIGARGVRDEPIAVTDPVEDAIRAAPLEAVGSGDVPAPIEMADQAALEASLSHAGVNAASTDRAAAPYRQADGSYRFDNQLRFWVLGRTR